MERHSETEQKIVASAEKLFYQKGKAGTAMQDIADDAGINRTLLNYYFRTKDQLFEAVFHTAMGRFVPDLAELIHLDMPVREFLPLMVNRIISAMIENPQIPVFVLQELNTNPERMPQVITGMGIDPAKILKKIEEESPGGLPSGMDPRQLILSLLSMCIFPFAARTLVTEIMFGADEDAFIAAMEERKKLVPLMVQSIMMMQKPMS